MTLATFIPPDPEAFDEPGDYGNAYWKARFAFIDAGHSERFEDCCAAVDPLDGTPYVFRVQQMYRSGPSGHGSTCGLELPCFPDADQAIAYLEAAVFTGLVQRVVAKPGGVPTWLTAGVAYCKWGGEQDYWVARNQTKDVRHFHPDLGQHGPEVAPCPYCYPTEVPRGS